MPAIIDGLIMAVSWLVGPKIMAPITIFVRIPDCCSHISGIIILVWMCSLYPELLWKIVCLSIDLVVVA